VLLVRKPSNRFWLGHLTVILLSAACAAAATPDWVRQAASQTLPPYDAETNAVVLLDEASITVSGTGDYREHYRKVVKILRPEGRTQADLKVYLEAKEKVHSIHCWSLDRSGKEYELRDKDFLDRGAFLGFDLYTDSRMRTGTCPAADPGSIIGFEYGVQRHGGVNEYGWEVQETVPVRQSRIVLSLPAGWEYKALWANGNAIEPVKTGDASLEWTLRDLPAIEHEPMRPPTEALALRMELTYFPSGSNNFNSGSWDALGRWNWQLISDRRIPTPELTQKARELTAGKTDFDGKVRALTSFLQSDVRYVLISIGIGGFQPHPAGDIFRARYGDCKDKATLLGTMLHEAGIESAYVLIHTERGIVSPTLPALDFNHAILAIELPDKALVDHYRSVVTAKSGKTYLIFDPTDPYTPLGDLRGELQDSYALLVANGGGELIRTPLEQPDANRLLRTGHFALSADGVLAGEVDEKYSGNHAFHQRLSLMDTNQKQRTELVERRLSRSLNGFSLENINIQNLSENQQDVQFVFKLNDPGYGRIRGPLMLVRPRVMGEKAIALERKPRRFPFQFEDTSRETDVYEFELPKEYAVEDVPDPVNVDMGFATYQSKVEVTGSKLRYSREFIRREVLIQPGRTEELRKMQAIIGADENAVVVLKRLP